MKINIIIEKVGYKINICYRFSIGMQRYSLLTSKR